MATVLQADINQLDRLAKKYSTEAKAVTLAIVAVVAASLSLLLAAFALNDAKEARARAEQQDKYITDLKESVDYWRAHVEAWRAELRARGIELELEGE